jgi:1,4-dihydroxy-2-naphthoate octaprenyltransferase
MSRPSQLLLIVAVYALGVAIAVGLGAPVDTLAVVVGVVTLLPVAASVHFANEYADYETDRLTAESATRTPFSGGSGALHAAGLPRSVARDATLMSGLLGAGLTVGLAVTGGLPAGAAIALALVALLGWGYSLPPMQLSRRGLGEVDNALLGGLLLPHYGAATLATPSLAVCFAVAPFTLLVFANLLATQWPDRWADAFTGKYTLPTRWSPRRLRRVHLLTVVAAFASLVALTGPVLPSTVTLASLLAVPFAVWGVATFTRDERPFPTVAAMVVMAVAQLIAWAVVADLLALP